MKKSQLKVVLFILSSIIIFIRYGNGFFIYGDSVGFFSHLPAVLVNQNLNYFDFFNSTLKIPPPISINGLSANIWGCGPALLWQPFFIFGIIILDLFHIPLTPFCRYQLFYFTNAGTFFYSILTIILAYKILGKIGLKKFREIILSASIFGTPFFYYMTFGGAMSHGPSAFAVTFFLYLCLINFRQSSYNWLWFCLGISSGLVFVIRPNNIVYLLFLLIPLKRFLSKKLLSKISPNNISWPLLFSFGFISPFVSQSLIWLKLYGTPFAFPNKCNFTFYRFTLEKILFSPFHGILFWTPLIFVSLLSFCVYLRRLKPIFKMLFLLFFLELILISFSEVWWSGYSFGIRLLSDGFPFIAIGLSIPLSYMSNKKNIYSLLGFYFLVSIWTFGIFSAFDKGAINLGNIVTIQDLLQIQKYWIYNPLQIIKTSLSVPTLFWIGIVSVLFLYLTISFLFFRLSKRSLATKLKYISIVILINITVFSGFTFYSYSRTPINPLTTTYSEYFTLEDELHYIIYMYRFSEYDFIKKTKGDDEANNFIKKIRPPFSMENIKSLERKRELWTIRHSK